MRRSLVLLTTMAAAAVTLGGAAVGEKPGGGQVVPNPDAQFATVFANPLGLEGLTSDQHGNLYSPGRGGNPSCPVFTVPSQGGEAKIVGTLPSPCSPAGLTFDSAGRLYVANADKVYAFTPDEQQPPAAEVFASGVPGANGVAFDRRGDLWISDGTTGQGRVWRAGQDGVPTEVFRVQPIANEVNVVDGVGGVGRDVRALPPGTVTITPTGRAAANTEGSQHLVANGLAFAKDGSLLVADTARGALWRVSLDSKGNLRSATGCDTTFTPNTLCLDNIKVAHPYLEGADGITLDQRGNVWVAVNERNSVAVVTTGGKVVEYFRNAPDPASRLRNTGPLEFPTSPVLLPGGKLCLAHSDGGRRDNFPPTGGEVGADKPNRAKLSCLTEAVS
ncbi:SMP-30/gluconolactonase/LRE family protein [Amycolatopsis magusensis]|uniref:SMP-30/gluconolactonase/LRE family protein n=1 Tax=Amycolatopsis magusensis TaxID=882444 RepID=UPI0024A86A16|nr:SMP-30/gluconolactonase/LRE family protein [Amycolatopsis magusensis]MDI5980941.1 SMP-30/gluconolactonase/LRE family protein [Amycolatopsis magusensis]